MHHVTQSYRISEAPMLRVALLVPDGFAILSFAPLAAFEAANLVLGERFYDVHVTSVAGGRLANSFGMEVETECVADSAFDTLLVGSPPDVCPPSQQLLSFLHGAPTNTRRVASICIAAFILGEAGLLDGRRVTTGLDLALSLVERDLGAERAREAARVLVMHHRRAGGQSQHSTLLDLDAKSDRVQKALLYARRNLSAPLSVENLADAACLTPRQFSRVFRAETGLSPAKAIENLRLEAARLMLEQGRLPIESIANETGFGDRERMRRSFVRAFGQTPQAIRNAAPPLASF